MKSKSEIYVLANNIRSAFNVGSIFRTSDAAGVSKIYLSGYSPTPSNLKLEKTALGSLDFVDWEYEKDVNIFIKKFQDEKIPIFSAEQTKKSVLYDSITYPHKMCLVMGNEISGVENNILEVSEKIIEIPMYGKKNSLNVATAYGILIYHIMSHIQ
ncbi:MAG: TrmH family RNA methyltransferase [Patescibacteria group bacterium]